MGFGVWGLGFGVWGLGFGVWGLGFGVWGLGFRVAKKPCKPPECRALRRQDLSMCAEVLPETSNARDSPKP